MDLSKPAACSEISAAGFPSSLVQESVNTLRLPYTLTG